MSCEAGMTLKGVGNLCKERGLFRTPELNEKLYLHFCGFKKIENLEEYVNCRAIWLENNCIERIENLEALCQLETLFVQHNFIRGLRISKSAPLTSQPLGIRTLDISHNFLDSLEDISVVFPRLEKLIAHHNKLKHIHRSLREVESLIVLDVSFNSIQDEDSLANVEHFSKLSSLMMQGNPVTKLPLYRKRVVAKIRSLTFLDEYPVFDEERRRCEALIERGHEAEKQVKLELASEQQEEKRKQMRYFDDVKNSILQSGKRNSTNTKYFADHLKQLTEKADAHVDPTTIQSIITLDEDADEDEDF